MDPDEVVFAIEVEDGPDGVVIRPRGELDMATQAELREVLEAHAPSGALTLDLAALRFLDTSGLRLILETAEAAHRGGFDFAVLPGVPAVMRLFDVAGVAELVPFRDAQDRGAP
jgi:anti-sigma B factor antagonist